MSAFIIYDITTGEIMRSGVKGDSDPSQAETSSPQVEYEIEGEGNDGAHYVDITSSPHTITEKTTNPSSFDVLTIDADGVDKATITGLCNPSYVDITHTGEDTTNFYNVEITDGELEITSNQIGTITVTIRCIPHTDYTEEITAE